MIPTPPAVSVVVPSLNAEQTLGEQLAALAGQDFDQPWEVVVVDNGSTDATSEVAHSGPCHPMATVRVVCEPRRGLNVARNAGVRAARAEIIAICDADDVVSDSWLSALLAGLGTADAVAGSLDLMRINPPQAVALRGARGTDATPGVARGLGFLDELLCGNVAFRRQVWEAIEGFDESFSRGGDDVDFSWRAQLAGFRVGYAPDAVIYYRIRPDRRSLFRQYVRDGEGSAHLYRRFRRQGMPRRSTGRAVRSAISLALRFGRWRGLDESERGHLLRAAGKQVGRVRGSIRHRVVYL